MYCSTHTTLVQNNINQLSTTIKHSCYQHTFYISTNNRMRNGAEFYRRIRFWGNLGVLTEVLQSIVEKILKLIFVAFNSIIVKMHSSIMIITLHIKSP